MMSDPVDLGPGTCGSAVHELARLRASSKTVNSVVTIGSNNWYREPMVKKAKPDKNVERHSMAGAPRCVTMDEIVGV